MSDPDGRLRLSEAAVELRAASGTGWERFLDALQGYSEVITTQCVTSAIDVLPQMQGRAQMIRMFLQLLKDAPQLVERTKNRK